MSTRIRPTTQRPAGEQGFTLVELLVVVGIIAIMAAVAIPGIGAYLRNRRILAAESQVAAEIQQARINAIMKNVNLGVLFMVVSNTEYQWVIEDDLDPAGGTNWSSVATEDWNVLVDPATTPKQAGVKQSLPFGIEFDPKCSNQTVKPPVSPVPGNAAGFRFSAVGGWCCLNTLNCPDVPNRPATQFIYSDPTGTGSTICLVDTKTGITRWVSVASGGRVARQP